jgi:hypothetical protein
MAFMTVVVVLLSVVLIGVDGVKGEKAQICYSFISLFLSSFFLMKMQNVIFFSLV